MTSYAAHARVRAGLVSRELGLHHCVTESDVCSSDLVTILTFVNPRNLLYGKEEHSAPQIEPSALRDQIEDIIYQRVKGEYLKPAKEE